VDINPDDPTEGPAVGRHRRTHAALARATASAIGRSGRPRRRWGIAFIVILTVASVGGLIYIGLIERPVAAPPGGAVTTASSLPESDTARTTSAIPTASTPPRWGTAKASPAGTSVPSAPAIPAVATTPPQPGPTPTATTGAVTATIRGINSRCLDIEHADNSDGSVIELWPCNGQDNQLWTLTASGSLQSLGKCARAAGGGTQDGDAVELWSCTGTADQRWRFDATGHLVNQAAGLCLDDPTGGQDYGIQLDVSLCQDARPQLWTMP
jgi:hypothetical protein